MAAAIRISFCFLLASVTLIAQSGSGKQCAAAPETEAAFETLNALRDSTPFSSRILQERDALESLRREHPDDIWLHRRYVNLIRDEFAGEWPALRQSYLDAAAANPDGAVGAYLAGWVLEGVDTPKALEFIERAKKLDPELSFPYLTLATNYSRGRWADQAKAGGNISQYFRLCPASSYGYAYFMLGRTAPQGVQREVAAKLRQRLEASADPEELKLFEHVWSLEFRSTPPADHAAIRGQIAKDLARIEELDIEPGAEWLAFLAKGYQQTNANPDDVTRIEGRLIAEFPRSWEATRIRRDRERKEYSPPETTAAPEEWEKWSQAAIARSEEWIDRYGPNFLILQHLLWDYQEVETLSAEQVRHVKARIIEPLFDRFGPRHFLLGRYIEFYFDHGLDPKIAAKWAELAHADAKGDMARRRADYLTDTEVEKLQTSASRVVLRNLALRLEAYRRLGDKEAAWALRSEIPSHDTGRAEEDVQHWALRAKLAEIEDRNADALAYYGRALDLRPQEPPARRGQINDPLLDDAKRLWSKLGGTEDAWSIWRSTAKRPRELTEGRWEETGEPLAPFELSDLTGRNWKLRSLEGKTVFLNLWATWCGPCQGELPHVQKLYEALKERAEFEVLTLNIDEDLGLVQPYIDEREFTFPVLPAYGYVSSVSGSLGTGIPQNWIVDGKGAWRWRQIGYNPDNKDWLGEMLRKLEATAKD